VQCFHAKQIGVAFVINTDAHSVNQLLNMQYGVITAARGGLERMMLSIQGRWRDGTIFKEKIRDVSYV